MDALGLLSLMSIGGSGSNIKVYMANQPAYTFTDIPQNDYYSFSSPNTIFSELDGATAICLPFTSHDEKYTLSSVFYETIKEGGTDKTIYLKMLLNNVIVSHEIESSGTTNKSYINLQIGWISNQLMSYFYLYSHKNNRYPSSKGVSAVSFLVIAFF